MTPDGKVSLSHMICMLRFLSISTRLPTAFSLAGRKNDAELAVGGSVSAYKCIQSTPQPNAVGPLMKDVEYGSCCRGLCIPTLIEFLLCVYSSTEQWSPMTCRS